MPRLLYFDAFSGLSGDMTLGALLHLGMPLDYLREGLAKLGLSGYRLEARQTEQHHIGGIKLDVILDEPEPPEHRSVTHIHTLLDASGLPERVRQRAKAIFWKLAVAEGKIHGIAPDEVHFHEVGAVDAIVDIVGSCLGFEYFDVTEFYCSALPVGSGFVRAAHGLMPVPAPATLELLAGLGATLTPVVTLGGGVEYPARGEMITPTGAALLAALCQPGQLTRPAMTLQGVGYGYGNRQFEWPNALRLWLGQRAATTTIQPQHTHAHNQLQDHDHAHSHHEDHAHEHDHKHKHQQAELQHHSQIAEAGGLTVQGEICQLEANLDDMTPEGLGYLMEQLLTAGALDVFFSPIQMKKNRPATRLSVLARPADEAALANLILTESSSFGVRTNRLQRYIADRELRQVETPLGLAQVKLKILAGRVVEAAPEYEDVAALARRHNRPWREVYEEVRQAARALLG